MPEVNTLQAAQIVEVSRITIWEDVKAGRLTARLEGRRGVIRIQIDDLRRYAKECRRAFNEELAQQFTQG